MFFGENDENLLIEIESACFCCFYFTTITSPARSAKASWFIVLVEIASGVVSTVFIRAFQFLNFDMVCGTSIMSQKLTRKKLNIRDIKILGRVSFGTTISSFETVLKTNQCCHSMNITDEGPSIIAIASSTTDRCEVLVGCSVLVIGAHWFGPSAVLI